MIERFSGLNMLLARLAINKSSNVVVLVGRHFGGIILYAFCIKVDAIHLQLEVKA